MKKDGVQTRKRKPRSSEISNNLNNEIKRRTNGGQNQHTRAATAAAVAIKQMQNNTLAHLQMQNNNIVLNTSPLLINENISASISNGNNNNALPTHLTMDFGSGEAIITVEPINNNNSSTTILNHGNFF